MVYFTSDLHLGHSNIISLCNRPFVNIEEMDKVLIEKWNRKVKKNDTVYVMGDIVWDKKKVAYYMEQLTGRKILVIGNHDSHWAKKEEIQNYVMIGGVKKEKTAEEKVTSFNRGSDAFKNSTNFLNTIKNEQANKIEKEKTTTAKKFF